MDVTQTILSASAIIGLLIGAVGGLAYARQNSVIKVITQDNQATKNYNKTLEDENTRCAAEIVKITAERDVYKAQAWTFKEAAQGSPQLKALTKAVENQTKVLSEYFKGGKSGRK
jgi:hypothetical protein